MADFDFSDVMNLAADLGTVEKRVIPLARKAVEFTANGIKKDWKPDAKVSGGARAYAASIDYEMQLDTDGVICAVIGPSLDRPGGSWGLLEDAPGGVTSAPQHAGRKAAAKNVADFEKGLLMAGGDALA